MLSSPLEGVKARRLGDHKRMLRRRIQRFELRYEMTTERMLEQTATGKLRETADISQWQFDADALKYLTAKRAKNTVGLGSIVTNSSTAKS